MNYCWEELASAIVMMAVRDYRSARRRVRRSADAKKPQETIRECEWFFRSSWFELLTDLNGEELLKELRSEVA